MPCMVTRAELGFAPQAGERWSPTAVPAGPWIPHSPPLCAAGCQHTRSSLSRPGERTDDDELSARGGTFGQHLGEVGVHRSVRGSSPHRGWAATPSSSAHPGLPLPVRGREARSVAASGWASSSDPRCNH